MRRPLSLVVLGVCCVLFAFGAVAPRTAGSEPSSQTLRGGTLRVDISSGIDSVDPALAYTSPGWELMNQTQCKLMNFPDREGAPGVNVVREAAQSFSRKGRTYTFTLRRGFRYSNGRAVTAADFRHAFIRAMSPRLQSPARAFTRDVGSVKASGQKLTVRLKRPAPDFLQRMSMPFFSAVPTNTPTVRGGVRRPLPSCGPYFVSSWTRGGGATLFRNPNYGGTRPANPDRIDFNVVPLEQQVARCESGAADVCSVTPTQAATLRDRYGLNQGRFFGKPTWKVEGLVINTQSRLFRGNSKLRQAVNYAIDRPQLVRAHGALGGTRTDQILRDDFPGGRNASIFPVNGPNLKRAQALARGSTRGGKAVFYTSTIAPGPTIAQVVQFNLRQIGVDVEVKPFRREALDSRIATRGEPFDIAQVSWGADYPDPYNFIDILLNGKNIQPRNNTNLAYFNNAVVNRRLDRAAQLSGPRRLRAYGTLDIDLTRGFAPYAPYMNANDRIFVSSHVTGFTYQPLYGVAYGALSVSPPQPTCSQPVTATMTTFVGQPHAQVFGECAALVAVGLAQIQMSAPAGKTIVAFAARSGSTCTGSGSSRTCSVLPDGRFCTILDFSPDAAQGDQVTIRLVRGDGSPLEEKTVAAGAEQANCSRAP